MAFSSSEETGSEECCDAHVGTITEGLIRAPALTGCRPSYSGIYSPRGSTSAGKRCVLFTLARRRLAPLRTDVLCHSSFVIVAHRSHQMKMMTLLAQVFPLHAR